MRRLLLLVGFLFLSATALYAQKTVSGKVTAATDGLPLPGVSVSVKNSPSNGTQTDSDGNFRLSVPATATTLVFKFIGYKETEAAIGNGTVTVSMQEDSKELSEVVVVGYGTQLRRDLTGSIAKVSSKDFEDVPLQTFESALQGRAAGVFINSGSGKLGQALQIRVRGISSVSAGNDPLYVIDGVPVVTQALGTYTEPDNPLAAISPEDIESIEVLKDAAASAIYGSRASNGVVLVTTKKGKAGRTNVDFGFFTGVSEPTHKQQFLNSAQYRELLDEAFAYQGYFGYADANDLWVNEVGTNDWSQNFDTNWSDAAFQKGKVTQYNVQVSGGDAKTRFLLGGTYNDTKGILAGNQFKRTSGRINIDHTISKIFDVGGSLNVAKSDNYRVPSDNAFTNPLQLNALPPIQPLRDAQGRYNASTVYYNNLIDLEEAQNLSTTFKGIATVFAQAKITDKLMFRSEYGLDFTNLEEEEYYGRRTQTGGPVGLGFDNNVKAINYNTNNTLSYSNIFNEKHNLQLLGGFSFQHGEFRGASLTGEGFPTDRFTKIASAATITTGTSTETEFSFVSYFARANYKFNDRYLLGATVRVDGSSRFGANKRYGTFPSVSLGWIASEEDFLKNSNWLSFLKLRGSYGTTGNAEIGNFASLTLYGGASYAGTPAVIATSLGDPNLTWENTATTDIALEFGLFNDRISGIVDVYKKKTSDLLLAVPIPATNGFTTITQNIGDLENKGLEITLNSQNMVNAFKWSTSFNISFNRNKITRLAGQPIYPGGRYIGRVAEGEPYGYFYGKAYAGVDPSNGDALFYRDASRTTTTNVFSQAADQKLGDPNPEFYGGLGNKFSYKGFDLDVQTQFVYGNDVFNSAGGFQAANGDYYDNQTIDQMRRWRNPGDITDVPQARFVDGNGTQASSRYIQDGSYFRVKNIVLGYTIPKAWISKLRGQSARIYMSALNPFTITNYEGYDPEINTTFAGRVQLGHDFYTPPQARTLSFGINVGF